MQTKIFFISALLAMNLSAFAQSSFSSTLSGKTISAMEVASFNLTVIPDKQSPSFILYVSNPEQKMIRLELNHQTNGLAADTSFNSRSYQRRYNFEWADDGRYTVTLTSGKERISKRIDINTVTIRNLVVE
jgi:hypothetical protein